MEPVTAVATAPWWAPAAIGAGGALLGGVISSAFGSHEASKNRDFQRTMSNTSHQREVGDLRAAGLNPILSARHGASTPPGASAQSGDFSGIGSSALQGLALASNLKLQDAQARDLNSAAAQKDFQTLDGWYTQEQRLLQMRASTELSTAQRRQIDEDIMRIRQQISNMTTEGKHSAYDLDRSRRESEFHKGPGGAIAPWSRTLGPAASKVMDIISRQRGRR